MSILSRIERHAELFGRMADTLGVDLSVEAQRGRAGAEGLRGAVFACTACRETDACEEWLAGHPDGATATPDYCRNKAMLERLARL